MRTVNIKASREYDVVIAKGLLDDVGKSVSELGRVRKAAVVSDSNVAPLYLERVTKSIEKEGIEAVSFVMKAGEEFSFRAALMLKSVGAFYVRYSHRI